MATINFKKFNPREMDDARRVLFLGKTNSGKSVLVKDILSYKTHIPYGTIFSATEICNRFWSKCVPDLFIHDGFNKRKFKEIIDNRMAQYQQMQEVGKSGSEMEPMFCLLDDCAYDHTLFKSDEMRFMYMNGRHLNIFFLVTMQYPMGMVPDCRANLDYIFILKNPIVAERKKIHQNYAGYFPTFESFCVCMDRLTSNYGCMVIDNTTNSNDIEDCVKWYKADPSREFRLGAEIYWKEHYYNYDPKHFSRGKQQLEVRDRMAALGHRKGWEEKLKIAMVDENGQDYPIEEEEPEEDF